MPSLLNVGVDTGGTFTDLVACQAGGGPLRMCKVPTTHDPSRALLEGLRALRRPGEEIARLTYGTTAVTNAVVEGRGTRVALVTTRGFRDVLEIGRQQRDHLYRLDVPGRTPPAVPRALRFEVTERVDHRGRVIVPIDEAEVLGLAETLRRAQVETVAVSFLHAYANPEHERRVGVLLGRVMPRVCLSSDVNPEFREYERTHTTCVNAQLMPLISDYLDGLRAGLAGAGLEVPLHLMQSSGGMATVAHVRQRPLALLMSGPAGGVTAARAVGSHAGASDAIALDMGGTSTDVCLIRSGQVDTVSERRILGQPVRMRSLAVESIGSGGGSIAWIDRSESLRVGPRSAGAEPGPACYDRGGEEPTVADAYVVLGYLGSDGKLGGLRLNPNRARLAIEPLARRLALAVHDAAAGIVEIANAAMHRAIRGVSVQRGVDPRHLTLIAYGGAGPMHAGRLMLLAGMRRVLVPPYSGAFSAYGCLVADLRYDAVRTVRVEVSPGGDAWEAPFQQMEEELLGRLGDEGFPAGRVVLRRTMDMRYAGQNYEIEVPVEPGQGAQAIRQRFSEYHQRHYEYATDEPVEVVNLRVTALVPSEVPGIAAMLPAEEVRGIRGERRAFFYGDGWATVPLYARSGLGVGDKISGPAIVEDEWSTVVVYPGQALRCDRSGLLWIEVAP